MSYKRKRQFGPPYRSNKRRKLDPRLQAVADDDSLSNAKRKKMMRLVQRSIRSPHTIPLREAHKAFDLFKELRNRGRRRQLDSHALGEIEAEKERCLGRVRVSIRGNCARFCRSSSGLHLLCALVSLAPNWARDSIYAEVKPSLVELADDRYARHLIQSLFLHFPSRSPERAEMVKSLSPHLPTLLTSQHSASVVDLFYSKSSPQTKNYWYSCLFGLRLDQELASESTQQQQPKGDVVLKDLLTPAKRVIVLRRARTLVEKILEKSIHVANVMALRVLGDFCDVGSPGEVRELVRELLPSLKYVVHLREGCRLGIMVISYANVKQRKVLLRDLNKFALELCTDRWGMLVFCHLLSVVDDTVLVGQQILRPLIAEFRSVLESPYGRKVILHLLAPLSRVYFNPSQLQLLNFRVRPGVQDCYGVPDELLDEDASLPGRSSKKPTEMILSQNLGFMSSFLARYAVESFDDVVSEGWTILVELICSLPDEFARPISDRLVTALVATAELGQPTEDVDTTRFSRIGKIGFRCALRGASTFVSALLARLRDDAVLISVATHSDTCSVLSGLLKNPKTLVQGMSLLAKIESRIADQQQSGRNLKFLGTLYFERKDRVSD